MLYPSITGVVAPATRESFSQSDRLLLLNAAFENNLNPIEFKVYYCLVRSMDDKNEVFELVDNIKDMCGIGRTSIINALMSLVQLGMIRKLGSRTRSYIYELTSPLDWVAKVQNMNLSTDSVLSPEQQDSTDPPFKGGSVESTAKECGKSVDCTKVQKTDFEEVEEKNTAVDVETEPVFADEYAKREALCKLGIQAGIVWIEKNTSIAVVNCVRMSVEEFMKRSWSSLTQSRRIYAPTL